MILFSSLATQKFNLYIYLTKNLSKVKMVAKNLPLAVFITRLPSAAVDKT